MTEHSTQLLTETHEGWPKQIIEPSNDRTNDAAYNGVAANAIHYVVAFPRYIQGLSSTVPSFLPWPKRFFEGFFFNFYCRYSLGLL